MQIKTAFPTLVPCFLPCVLLMLHGHRTTFGRTFSQLDQRCRSGPFFITFRRSGFKKKKYFCYPLWPRCNTRVQQEHLFFVIVICRFVKSESTKGATAISVLTLILPTFVPARRLWMSSHLSWFHFLTLKGSRERKKTYRDSNRCGTLGIYCHWVAKIAVVHILHRSCCAFKTHPILL